MGRVWKRLINTLVVQLLIGWMLLWASVCVIQPQHVGAAEEDLIAWTYPCEPDRDGCYDLYPRQFVVEGQKIIAEETRGSNPSERWRAVGQAGERCEFQIHPIHVARVTAMGLPWLAIHNPQVCRQVAYQIWKSSGWRPWSTRYVVR
jgi:hypothetical protein